MLNEFVIDYEDGTTETKIIKARYVDGILQNKEDLTHYPQRDKIKNIFHKTFKYQVEKHPYLPVAILKLSGKTTIMPAGIECHPETELSDIEEIIPEGEIEKKPRQQRTWKFKSESSDSVYAVKENWGKLSCNCPGVWRAKDRKCKHIKEVEKEINNKNNE